MDHWSELQTHLQNWDPFYLHGLNLVPAWISNYMPSKVWDEIIYQSIHKLQQIHHSSVGMDK